MKIIGKGSFSKVYHDGVSKNVKIVSIDHAKECLSMEWHRNYSGVFPKCEQLGEYNTYAMPYYERVSSLKKSLKPDQYKLYKDLRDIMMNLCDNRDYLRNKYDRSFFVYNAIRDSKIHGKVKNDILSMIEALQNYGSDVSFEISPRNVAVKNGKLILLDCFFMQKQLDEIRS